MIPSEPDDRDVLAGEYVLGLLPLDAATELERALPGDPDLAGRVAFWETQLLPAAATIEPVQPDVALWGRIERSLIARRQVGAGEPRPGEAAFRALRGIWDSAAIWRLSTALAVAAALVIAIVPLRRAVLEESPTRFFALLQSRDEAGRETGPGWLIQIAQDGTVRSLPLAEVRAAGGRALQLWTLWDQARGPVSLGVLPVGGAIRLPAERLEAIGSGQLFEITLEPEAGSPTGRPTGRILFIGRAQGAETRAL